MARDPSDAFRDSVYFGRFLGINNVSSRDRLMAPRVGQGSGEPAALELAKNIDIDNDLKARRRRGRTRVVTGDYHSLWHGPDRTFVVKDGALGTIAADFSFTSILAGVGPTRLAYVQLGPVTYFSGETVSGKVLEDGSFAEWGTTDGAGQWVSPVLRPTTNVGAVNGRQLTAPPKATALAEKDGRIYLAEDKILWATEYMLPDHVNRTRNFMQFEAKITALGSVDAGIVVGTRAGTYLLSGPLAEMRRTQIDPYKTIPGSMIAVDSKMLGDNGAGSDAVMYMTDHGVCAVTGDGAGYNVTENRVIIPDANSAAALFRQQDGINQYVGVTDTGGTPTSKARIGDYVDAEIRRFQGG